MALTARRVDGHRDGLKVAGVAARPMNAGCRAGAVVCNVVTYVVENKASRHRAESRFISETVRQGVLAATRAHHAVASGLCGQPWPAVVRPPRLINVLPEQVSNSQPDNRDWRTCSPPMLVVGLAPAAFTGRTTTTINQTGLRACWLGHHQQGIAMSQPAGVVLLAPAPSASRFSAPFDRTDHHSKFTAKWATSDN